jgi:hypothetical protein
MNPEMRWYDSIWLNGWFAAREIVARHAPAKLPEFVASFEPLRTDPGFVVRKLRGLFDADELEHIRKLIKTVPREDMEMHELQRFGRLVVHDYPAFTTLQETLTDKVSDWAGEEVEPSYNFLCLYSKMGVCEPHMDAPSAKWTLDVCIDQSDIWPIHFSEIVPWPEQPQALDDDWQNWIKNNPDLHFEPQLLEPGDAVLFSGSSQWHYRDPLPPGPGRGLCYLLFFHFIPKGCGEIIKPANWARLFDVPELANLPAAALAL